MKRCAPNAACVELKKVTTSLKVVSFKTVATHNIAFYINAFVKRTVFWDTGETKRPQLEMQHRVKGQI